MSKTKKKQKTMEELLKEALVPEEEQPYEVPGNWVWVKLKAFNTNKKRAIKPKDFPKETFELYSVPSYEGNQPELITGEEIGSNKYLVEAGEVLLCKINPRINRVWLVGNKKEMRQLASTEWIVINKNPAIIPKYLLSLLKSPYFRKLLTSNVSGVGGSLTRARPKEVENYPIALPPISEQKRIADKVERLLNKIDEARRLIEEAKETFELRRAAILDKAFRGELTARWRENTDSFATADQLLNKIGGEKDMKNDPLDGAVLSNLFNLPKGWKWVRLNDLIESSTYGTSSKTNDDTEGVPVIRMGNILDGNLVLDNLKYLPTNHADVTKLDLEENDLLFNRTNSYELVGKTAIVNSEIAGKMTFASYLIRIRLLYKEVLANYVCHYINSHIGRGMLMTMVTQQVGQANINSKKLAALPIPLPPEKEIKEISSLLNSFFQRERITENILFLNENLESLKQSILSKAFRGELGTNDPAEESAVELLKEVLMEKV